jgi:mannose/cellobiose epimerase-like protein (N-acyl-D-glucosamine 2-epimerase family)
MYPQSPASLTAFYRGQLEKDIVMFWDKAWDSELGGVYTCFCNDGSRDALLELVGAVPDLS